MRLMLLLLLLLVVEVVGLLLVTHVSLSLSLWLTNNGMLVQFIVRQVVGEGAGYWVLAGVAVLGHVVVAPGLGGHLEKIRVGVVVVHCGQQGGYGWRYIYGRSLEGGMLVGGSIMQPKICKLDCCACFRAGS